MGSNNTQGFHGSAYDDAYCEGCKNLDTFDLFGKDIDVQVVRNNNSFSDYDDGIEKTSIMKWKKLVRRLRSDTNDEYHEETIDFWKTKVVVQVIMPNDYSKQDQHNQRKPLKRSHSVCSMPNLLNHLDSICLMPDPINHHDSICSVTDPYSNKQWNQPNHHDHSKQDLYGPLKHVYNRMTYYGEQRFTLYIINHCSGSINNYSYDNLQVWPTQQTSFFQTIQSMTPTLSIQQYI